MLPPQPFPLPKCTSGSFQRLASSTTSSHLNALRQTFQAHESSTERVSAGRRAFSRQLAQNRRRYQHMVELQHQSLLGRQEYSKEREQQAQESEARVQARVRLAKQQQNQLGRSTQDWHRRNLREAAELRLQRLADQLYCTHREHLDLMQKKDANYARRNSFRMVYRSRSGKNSPHP